MFEIGFSGTCSIKSSYNRRIIFILCISIPYFIISLCYLDILRTIRNSKAGLSFLLSIKLGRVLVVKKRLKKFLTLQCIGHSLSEDNGRNVKQLIIIFSFTSSGLKSNKKSFDFVCFDGEGEDTGDADQQQTAECQV